MSDALDVLYASVYARLRDGDALWGVRVFPDEAPGVASMPYVVYQFVDGGENNTVRPRSADFRINVRVVTTNSLDAMSGAGAIASLLNDMGEQDGGVVVGDAAWRISTITQGRRLHDYDPYERAEPVYISGHQFEIFMQEKV